MFGPVRMVRCIHCVGCCAAEEEQSASLSEDCPCSHAFDIIERAMCGD